MLRGRGRRKSRPCGFLFSVDGGGQEEKEEEEEEAPCFMLMWGGRRRRKSRPRVSVRCGRIYISARLAFAAPTERAAASAAPLCKRMATGARDWPRQNRASISMGMPALVAKRTGLRVASPRSVRDGKKRAGVTRDPNVRSGLG